MNRREFLKNSLLASAVAPFTGRLLGADSPPTAPALPVPKGKAEHCIFIWLGGGMGQIDTFDPKNLGVNKGTPKKPGSLYASIETAVPGVRLCEHLAKTARVMEHVT